jgi:hypothetical protein
MFDHLVPKFETPDPSLGFEASVRSLVGNMVRQMSDQRYRTTLPAVLLLKMHHSGVAVVEERLRNEQRGVFEDICRRGVAEGRIPASTDVDLFLTLLLGPLLMAMVMETAEVTDVLAERAVGQFLAGLALQS